MLQEKFHIVLLSQEYATQDIYLLLKENFSEFSCAEFFSTKDIEIFPHIRGVTIQQEKLNLLSGKPGTALFSTIFLI